jgi:hypothetical protein
MKRNDQRIVEGALRAMRNGETLRLEFSGGRERYWLTPSNRGIPGWLAAQIRQSPDITSGRDGLWPQVAQTWHATRKHKEIIDV